MKEEIRSFEFERRSDEDPRKIFGYAAVFGQQADIGGMFREQIAPGAFTQTLLSDDIRALYNHDSSFVFGRNKAGTLRLSEDSQGLSFEIDPPDTSWANDVLVSINRGDISAMSFGFQVLGDQWTERDAKTPLRTLTKVRLLEISPVTFPAYTGTSASVRSAEEIFNDLSQLERGGSDALSAHRLVLDTLRLY